MYINVTLLKEIVTLYFNQKVEENVIQNMKCLIYKRTCTLTLPSDCRQKWSNCIYFFFFIFCHVEIHASFKSLIHHCSALLGVIPKMSHIGSSSVNIEDSWDSSQRRDCEVLELFGVTDTSKT